MAAPVPALAPHPSLTWRAFHIHGSVFGAGRSSAGHAASVMAPGGSSACWDCGTGVAPQREERADL